MINFIFNLLGIFLLYIVIAGVWTFAELKIYKEVTPPPRLIDDIVAIVLAISIFLNITK